MTARRFARKFLTIAAPVAAAVTVGALFAAPASADPPHPFGGPAYTIGCPNQGSIASVTAVTGQSGAPIGPGQILFESHPALPPIPAAGQMTVAWVNTNTGQSGIVNLMGTYPNLSALVTTGPGNVVATAFGSINFGSSPICQDNPTIGTFVV
ncbi:hypothetical protein G4X40_21645 [Rhodococcus sp. D2-41]|uniref:Uncharacterized protein n=1 Tax=Speluncibacter jeojiensis TaxID=2710754 RepID=A0A9X4RE24_9ACTN|nr:hypothetical protein [Rhodococcus sp. D2-41]MDG3012747.1 hypothetical protein [Rhodococcus sp. D2-41]MDG3015425.1 hypothetical protein [Corynebacteriales bacterium D3-21]